MDASIVVLVGGATRRWWPDGELLDAAATVQWLPPAPTPPQTVRNAGVPHEGGVEEAVRDLQASSRVGVIAGAWCWPGNFRSA